MKKKIYIIYRKDAAAATAAAAAIAESILFGLVLKISVYVHCLYSRCETVYQYQWLSSVKRARSHTNTHTHECANMRVPKSVLTDVIYEFCVSVKRVMCKIMEK